jgi:hypothetical protein
MICSSPEKADSRMAITRLGPSVTVDSPLAHIVVGSDAHPCSPGSYPLRSWTRLSPPHSPRRAHPWVVASSPASVSYKRGSLAEMWSWFQRRRPTSHRLWCTGRSVGFAQRMPDTSNETWPRWRCTSPVPPTAPVRRRVQHRESMWPGAGTGRGDDVGA